MGGLGDEGDVDVGPLSACVVNNPPKPEPITTT
jgi:hypothetical protein